MKQLITLSCLFFISACAGTSVKEDSQRKAAKNPVRIEPIAESSGDVSSLEILVVKELKKETELGMTDLGRITCTISDQDHSRETKRDICRKHLSEKASNMGGTLIELEDPKKNTLRFEQSAKVYRAKSSGA